VRLGAVFPQGELGHVDADTLVDLVTRLEDAGYDHLVVYDHVLGASSEARPDWTGPYDHEDPFLEPLTLFGFLLGQCGLELMTGVLVLPQRQTALVAKQVATLALLAPGRIRLGVGIGWNDVEYDGLGIDFRTRTRRIEEQVPLLRRLWTEPVVDGAVGAEVVTAAGIAPLPPAPVPIWFGSGGHPAALERVGRLGDGWIPMPGVRPGNGLDEALDAIRRAATDAGRDPGAIGLEAQVLASPDRLPGLRAKVDEWEEGGASAVAVNPLRAGLRWPDEHLDVLLRAADALR
jgi:probable F420-dependent oxidoreductase